MLYSISKFGKVPGKKALQKMVYFANIKTNSFVFRWHKYGPYSEELKYDLDAAIMEKLVHVEPVPLPKNDGIQFDIKLSIQGRRALRATPITKEMKTAVELSYKLLNHKGSREMELLASVHYIINQKSYHDEEDIWNSISELKPKQTLL